MGAHTTDRFRATAAPSIGSRWENAPYIYDGDFSTYAERKYVSTSATHINGFGISLPNNATVTSLEVHSRLYASGAYSYIWVYVYTDEGPTSVFSTEIVNNSDLKLSDHRQIYTAEQIKEKLDSKGLCNGDIMQFLKTLRVRFVMGSTKTATYQTTCRVYDNYVVVNYTIPDITVTTSVSPAGGGTVTGGGTYESGSTVTATAIANSGYVFSHWLVNAANLGNSNPISGALTADTTVTAVFEKVQNSKIYYGSETTQSVFDTQKNKAKSVWYGMERIL